MIARVLFFLLLSPWWAMASDYNAVVLEQISRIPGGGRYATDTGAHQALTRAVSVTDSGARITPSAARPSYCSGATYLALLMALQDLEKRGEITITPETWEAIRPQPLPDGTGIWGRWNANGPGTARLFYELGLGRNFTDIREARPGDFLKVFWTDAVGQNERGHSVVFLGTETVNGQEMVKYWSSNKPDGMGTRSVSRKKIAWMLFSRLEHPERIAAWASIPQSDAYLASLLRVDSSRREALKLSGATP